MEHSKLDSLKATLNILTAAGVSKYRQYPDGSYEVEFHRPTPPATPITLPTVPRSPVDEQLAAKHPQYAKVFPMGFPTHAPKDTPKAE